MALSCIEFLSTFSLNTGAIAQLSQYGTPNLLADTVLLNFWMACGPLVDPTMRTSSGFWRAAPTVNRM